MATENEKAMSEERLIREARNNYHREYRRKNRKKICENQRKWQEKNRDKIKDYNRKYWLRKAEGKQAN